MISCNNRLTPQTNYIPSFKSIQSDVNRPLFKVIDWVASETQDTSILMKAIENMDMQSNNPVDICFKVKNKYIDSKFVYKDKPVKINFEVADSADGKPFNEIKNVPTYGGIRYYFSTKNKNVLSNELIAYIEKCCNKADELKNKISELENVQPEGFWNKIKAKISDIFS